MVTLTPFSRSHKGLRLLANGLSAPYLMKEWLDFDQTCTSILLWHEKNWLDFGDLDPIFKVTGGLRLLENDFSAPFLQNERMLLTNLVQLYCWDRDKKWLDFGNLDPIFKDTGGSDCWKMACLHPISRMNLRILTQLVHLYCCDMEKKNWSDFGDLDSIFKVTQGLRLLKNGLSAPYHEGMDGFWPNLQYYIVTWKKKLIRFWWPWPHFQGHKRAQIVGKWLFCTLSPERMDGFWPNLYSFIVETGTRTD